ncbi:hypothetical protein EI545_18665 [Tabrizicola piscis]|uniref:Uncharacterized protein n=1 Tax=Tabrizicola piscis TaxID=2494374 RepID=A0A3S8UB21_9RHOB|nr:hypothetical protein [Tabrizicola piscis]AZL60665.1 hypothetical protein EI545_18665 [Tabrizicola piscis]
MFNLIVSGRVNDDRRGFIFAERVFGYTSKDLESQFTKGDLIDFDSLMRFPALLMEEGRSNEIARIAWISRVTRKGADFQIDYTIDSDLPKLTNADIEEMQTELDMHDWEFGTNHWAVKDVDLFEILLKRAKLDQPKPSVFQLSAKPIDPKLISFMMPFDGSFNSVYQGIKAVLEADGFTCRRADDMWVHAHVMTDIIELICTSVVVICDLSRKNPNVFYEAGIAHTLGKQVILISQSHDDVPFDLRPIRYLSYLNNGEGIQKLAEEVMARVRSIT